MIASPSERALSALIGSVYDCALDPSLWKRALADVALALGCEKAILSLNDLGHDRVLINKSFGWEPYWLEQRETHLPEIHYALAEWLQRKASLEEPFIASRHTPAGYLETSPYVRECLSPQGIVDIAHFLLISTPTHFSELVLGWQDSHGVMTEREIELGALLLPHVRRAVTINRLLDMATIARSTFESVLDTLTAPIFLTTADLQVVHANQAAQAIIAGGELMNIRNGVLIASVSAVSSALAVAVSQAARDESAIGRKGLGVPIRWRDGSAGALHVLPLHPGRGSFDASVVAAVFVARADTPFVAPTALVAALFGLTPAEARVFEQIVAGRTVEETSDALNIGRSTVRTHLLRLFDKTGVRRQAELVQLAASLASPVAAGV